jgi:hypothetical protein
MNMIWLIRAARWARNPPSLSRVLLVLGVVAACLVLYGIEWMGLWPDWLRVNPPMRP